MIDDYGSWDETPLHQAVRQAWVEECRALLGNGADPNAIDSYGSTPLSSLLLRAELMLDNGIEFSRLRTREQFERELIEILVMLLDNGATYEKATQHYMFNVLPKVKLWYRDQVFNWHVMNMEIATAPALAPTRKAARL
ncbi:MAG: ankyrin repeat domain-containing protein [Lysobacter sp.]|nr:ankyrin repeat domain-containing protein [Lysobacter sp.]